jgi:hypothetical protein
MLAPPAAPAITNLAAPVVMASARHGEWPGRIQLDYLIGSRRECWEESWDSTIMLSSSIEAAPSLWLGIIHAHLMDLTEPPLEHQRAASSHPTLMR